MRLLLDENVPRKLRRHLPGHDVYTVQELRGQGDEDEEVLQFLEAFNFDALITCDKNLRFQQNLVRYPRSIIVLDAYTNAYPILKQLIPKLLVVIEHKLPTGATIIEL